MMGASLDPKDPTHKIIHAGDARTDLIDALANLAHVLRHQGVDGDTEPSDDVIEFALGVELANAMPSAMMHYRAERDGDDGTRVTVEGED